MNLIVGNSKDIINIYQKGDYYYYEKNNNENNIVFDYTINGGCKITNESVSNPMLTINFTSDITFTYRTQYFIIGSDYILIDGLNNIITINGVNDI